MFYADTATGARDPLKRVEQAKQLGYQISRMLLYFVKRTPLHVYLRLSRKKQMRTQIPDPLAQLGIPILARSFRLL